MPTTNADLATVYSGTDVTNVATQDGVYVGQDATNQYAIHQYKNFISAGAATFTWIGKTNEAGTYATIHLQIYNVNTTTWEDLATNSTVAANTDFTLTAFVANLTNYKDGSNVVTCRIYQLDM